MAFTESFTAAAFTNLESLSGWTRGSGTAGDAYVNSNQLSNAHSGGADAYYVCTSQGSADHNTQAAVHGSGGGFICVRLTDANNFIGFRHDSSTGAWQVYKRVAEGFTQLGSDYTVALTPGDVGNLDANGNTLIFTVNGTQRCLGTGVTDSFNNTEVRQGVVARGTTSNPWIDDFVATGPAVAPTLTSPTGAATGNTTANVGATTDAGSGTLYASVSASAPSAAQIKLGQDSTGAATTSGNVAVSSPGAKTIGLTAVATGSRSVWLVHNTTAGDSNVVNATWTQAAAPVLSSPTNTPGSTTALIGATTTVSSGTAYFLPRVGGSAASAATIIATGQTSTVTTTTPSRTVTGLTASTANNYVDIVQVSGVTTSNVVSTAAFTTTASGDVTPPTLTSPVATGGSLTCSGSVTTNEANGTLYTVFCASATPPTALQVEAGQDSLGAAAPRAVSQAVSATGSQSVVSGAITAGTRYAYFMHKDAAGNRSAVAASGSFAVTGPATYSLSCGPFSLNPGSGPVLGVAVSYTLTPGEVGAASGASINGTGTLHASTGLLTVTSLAAAGLYSVQIKNADGSSRWHGTATAA